jgi:phosphopantothenoylcysteine decarboxylase/phosphopantothenate--cysteine ligase
VTIRAVDGPGGLKLLARQAFCEHYYRLLIAAAPAQAELVLQLHVELTVKAAECLAIATREALDPVRYLTNHSSGRQGWALARVAALRGADVTLVTGPTALAAPAGVTVVTVVSARDMHDAVMSRAARMDAVVMAAAVADHRPAEASATKLKKSAESPPPSVDLVANPDILADVSASVGSPTVVVGFAAETGDAANDVITLGRVKLASKGCDLLVVNDVSGGRAFGSTDNEAVILHRDGGETPVSRRSKEAVAATIWDEVVSRMPGTVSAT